MTIYNDAPTVLPYDVPCRNCQYNLRGLPTNGHCPECGTPVEFSTRGDLIRYSHPDWIATLRKGILLILSYIVALIFLSIGGAVLAGARTPGARPLQAPAIQLLQFLVYGLYIYGAWLLTTPDPSGLGEDRYGKSRQYIRFMLATASVGQLLQFFQSTSNIPPAVAALVQIIQVIFTLIGLIGTFFMLNYLKKLALRIPDDKLAGRAGFLMYAIGISYGGLLAMGLLAIVTVKGGGPNPGLIVFGCGAALLGVALIVFGIMYLIMLEKFAKRFKEESAYARSIWREQG